MVSRTVTSRILNEFGKPMDRTIESMPANNGTAIQARYDAARHDSAALGKVWQNADRLSPDNANRLAVRRWLRERSRYECIENNPYLIGTLRMICTDFVGSGPKLQITDKRIPKEQQRKIEAEYIRWTKAIGYRETLQGMRMAKIVTGESFKMSFYNQKVRNKVKLAFRNLEADRISTEYLQPEIQDHGRIRTVDGIKFDRFENPASYYILKSHPGGYWYQGNPMEGTWFNSVGMRHWYRKDREWHRGIPELTASLPLCALLRRYTIAVVLAAETAADFAAVLESEVPPSVDPMAQGVNGTVFDQFPINKGMFTALPWGYKLSQIKSEQPVTHYDEFVNALIKEIIHPLLVPFNYHSGSSANSNMASASVDVDVYKRMQKGERYSCEDNVLDEDAWQWWQEGMLIDGYLGGGLGEFTDEMPDHTWRWDQVAQDHSDPAKVANAIDTLSKSGHITDRDVQEIRFNRSLEDWQDEIRDQMEFRKEIGLLDPGLAQLQFAQNEAAETAGAAGLQPKSPDVADKSKAAQSKQGQPAKTPG